MRIPDASYVTNLSTATLKLRKGRDAGAEVTLTVGEVEALVEGLRLLAVDARKAVP